MDGVSGSLRTAEPPPWHLPPPPTQWVCCAWAPGYVGPTSSGRQPCDPRDCHRMSELGRGAGSRPSSPQQALGHRRATRGARGTSLRPHPWRHPCPSPSGRQDHPQPRTRPRPVPGRRRQTARLRTDPACEGVPGGPGLAAEEAGGDRGQQVSPGIRVPTAVGMRVPPRHRCRARLIGSGGGERTGCCPVTNAGGVSGDVGQRKDGQGPWPRPERGGRPLTFWPCMFQVATKRATFRSGKYRASSSAPIRAPLARRLPSR